MAQYKVLQDIEAEDKLLGPLSLRQFIYAVIVVVLGFTSFKLLTIKWFLIFPLVPPMVFFALLAAPFGHDQPSEVWLLGKIRFIVKPRKRIWDQSGIKELVTITVPKKIEQHYTKGFSQGEVKSRLQALAATLDTRGWAVKNMTTNVYTQPLVTTNSERLIDIDSVAPAGPVVDENPADDIMDTTYNPTAQHVQEMIESSTQQYHQELVDKMRNLTTKPAVPASPTPTPVAPLAPIAPVVSAPPATPVASPPITAADEQALLKKIHADDTTSHLAYGHMRTINPLSSQPQPAAQTPTQQMTPKTDPAILKLANDNDKTVATIARQAKRPNNDGQLQDEVVISLH